MTLQHLFFLFTDICAFMGIRLPGSFILHQLPYSYFIFAPLQKCLQNGLCILCTVLILGRQECACVADSYGTTLLSLFSYDLPFPESFSSTSVIANFLSCLTHPSVPT